MGYSTKVGVDRFPKQGAWLGKTVVVGFHDDDRILRGTVVRDDIADPGVEIIRLEDGRHVLTTECVYALETAEKIQTDLGSMNPHTA